MERVWGRRRERRKGKVAGLCCDRVAGQGGMEPCPIFSSKRHAMLTSPYTSWSGVSSEGVRRGGDRASKGGKVGWGPALPACMGFTYLALGYDLGQGGARVDLSLAFLASRTLSLSSLSHSLLDMAPSRRAQARTAAATLRPFNTPLPPPRSTVNDQLSPNSLAHLEQSFLATLPKGHLRDVTPEERARLMHSCPGLDGHLLRRWWLAR